MKPIKSFDAFLRDHVNLNQTRVDTANGAFDTLTSYLKNAGRTSDEFIETSRQGSLRQGTIIKPRSDETEFDVDLLLRLEVVAGWSPTSYLDTVHQAFKDSDRYRDLVDRRGKHRCVTIDYAGDFHVDVVPSIEVDGQCWIMNRDADQFEPSDGDGYALWFESRGKVANGMLARVVRLTKYLRDEHGWPVKSVLLTTLLGMMVQDGDTQAEYPDVPTSLQLLLSRLNVWLASQVSAPNVSNPALPEEQFTRHWDNDTFTEFKEGVTKVSGLVATACDSANEDDSAKAWTDAFGEKFTILEEDLGDGESVATAPTRPSDSSHARPLTEVAPVGVQISRTVRLSADIYNAQGKVRFGGLPSGTKVRSDRALRFSAWTDAKGSFDVYWQVVNTGAHAARENALRGGFQKGRTLDKKPAGQFLNWEHTEYTGSHWIECFIVQNGVCIARSGRFVVNIKNPKI